MPNILTRGFLLCLALCLPLLAKAEMQKGFRNLLDAVVRIDVREVAFEAGTKHYEASIGSGVIISQDGLVLTNAHVISPRAVEISVTLASLETVNASFVGWDHWTDLAVIRLDMSEVARRKLTFSHGDFSNAEDHFSGQTVYAVGTPHGLARTVTRGIISNSNRYFEDNRGVRGYETGSFNTWIQTDAAINPGNSGGPLVDESGKIVGINARGYIGADNLGFAIPSNIARLIAAELVAKGSVTRSYIGLVPGALRDLENFYALQTNTGVLINSVDVSSPAAKAGLRGGDILLSIDGHKVDGRFPEQLPPIQNSIASRPVGSVLKLAIKRGNDTRELSVSTEKLESRLGEEWSFERWGLSVRTVSKAYARENQLPDDRGLLIIGIQSGFPADIAGLQRGDIIVSINQRQLGSLDEAKTLHTAFEGNPQPTLVEARRNRGVSLYVMKP